MHKNNDIYILNVFFPINTPINKVRHNIIALIIVRIFFAFIIYRAPLSEK